MIFEAVGNVEITTKSKEELDVISRIFYLLQDVSFGEENIKEKDGEYVLKTKFSYSGKYAFDYICNNLFAYINLYPEEGKFLIDKYKETKDYKIISDYYELTDETIVHNKLRIEKVNGIESTSLNGEGIEYTARNIREIFDIDEPIYDIDDKELMRNFVEYVLTNIEVEINEDTVDRVIDEISNNPDIKVEEPFYWDSPIGEKIFNEVVKLVNKEQCVLENNKEVIEMNEEAKKFKEKVEKHMDVIRELHDILINRNFNTDKLDTIIILNEIKAGISQIFKKVPYEELSCVTISLVNRIDRLSDNSDIQAIENYSITEDIICDITSFELQGDLYHEILDNLTWYLD